MIKNNSLCHVVVLCILSGEQRKNCFPYPPIYTNIYTTIQIVLWKMTSHRNFSNELIFACYFLKISYYIPFLWSVSKWTAKLRGFQIRKVEKRKPKMKDFLFSCRFQMLTTTYYIGFTGWIIYFYFIWTFDIWNICPYNYR